MGRSSDDQSERFQVVDEHDRELRTATRAECHADPGLIHRSVFVIVETDAGRLFQRRGLLKDTHPGWWCLSCAGHVAAGESYAESARRELAEETGIEGVELERIGTLLMRFADETEMAGIFAATHSGEMIVRPPEVIGLVAFPAGSEPDPLTPSARLVLDFLHAQKG